MFLLVVCSHYVSRYDDHYHHNSTFDMCSGAYLITMMVVCHYYLQVGASWRLSSVPLFRFYLLLNINILDVSSCSVFPLCFKVWWPLPPQLHLWHVLWGISHHHDGYTCSHLCGPGIIGSAGCGSATKANYRGHIEGFCLTHECAMAMATLVPEAFSGICQLCHGSSIGKFLFY